MKRIQRSIHTIKTIKEMREFTKQININHIQNKSNNNNINKNNDLPTIGFIPTMGALHQGHLSLIERALNETNNIIVSIFVNPTQFSIGEDLDKYPRTIENDLKLLSKYNIKGVFIPTTNEIYSSNPLCHVEPLAFSKIYEGEKRPNFFSGVATIVCKLFNIVQPTHAYFGQKDISQFILLRRMVDDLNIPVHVKASETLRESDGLAMSSRNVYLTPSERNVASILYKSLQTCVDYCENPSFSNNGNVSTSYLRSLAKSVLDTEPLVSEIQYISIASPYDMKELEYVNLNDGAVISAAIKVGSVRLIDNLLIGNAKKIIYN